MPALARALCNMDIHDVWMGTLGDPATNSASLLLAQGDDLRGVRHRTRR